MYNNAVLRISCRRVRYSSRRDLIDTNILVAAFLPGDEESCDDAMALLEMVEQVIVTEGVLAEAWGMIVGARRNRDQGELLLRWLLTRGNIIVLPHWEWLIERSEALVRAFHVDLIDSVLGVFADHMTNCLDLVDGMIVASMDLRDFSTIRYKGKIKMRFYDLRSGDIY